MNRTERNFWLDMSIFAALAITAITGILLWLVNPHSLGLAFLGPSRGICSIAHIGFGAAGLAGVIVHIVWHWDWLKGLRGRPLREMPRKLCTNRIVDRILWLTYMTANGFGVMAWALRIGADHYMVRVPDRLHGVFGIACTMAMAVHLTLHWKWIASAFRRYIQIHIGAANTLQKPENL